MLSPFGQKLKFQQYEFNKKIDLFFVSYNKNKEYYGF